MNKLEAAKEQWLKENGFEPNELERASFVDGWEAHAAATVPADGEVRVAVDICETLRIGILREADTPRPFCRDCADEDGICPRTNFPCDLREAADALRSLIAAVSGDEQKEQK